MEGIEHEGITPAANHTFPLSPDRMECSFTVPSSPLLLQTTNQYKVIKQLQP